MQCNAAAQAICDAVPGGASVSFRDRSKTRRFTGGEFEGNEEHGGEHFFLMKRLKDGFVRRIL